MKSELKSVFQVEGETQIESFHADKFVVLIFVNLNVYNTHMMKTEHYLRKFQKNMQCTFLHFSTNKPQRTHWFAHTLSNTHHPEGQGHTNRVHISSQLGYPPQISFCGAKHDGTCRQSVSLYGMSGMLMQGVEKRKQKQYRLHKINKIFYDILRKTEHKKLGLNKLAVLKML